MKEYKETYTSAVYKNNSELALYSAGFENCAPNQGYGPRIRPYHMIHFVTNGEGILQIDQDEFNFEAGNIFLIPADKISYYESSEKNPCTYFWANFLGIQSENYMQKFMSASKQKYILKLSEIERFTAIITDILNLQGSPTYLYLMGNSLLLRILSYLINEITFTEKLEKTSPADDLKFYLDMHYAEKFQLRDIAEKLGFHQNYLTRIFAEKFSVTPKKYLIDLKLKKACNLLASTNLPVNLISTALGFDDPMAFSKKFSEVYSVSPTKYRSENN